MEFMYFVRFVWNFDGNLCPGQVLPGLRGPGVYLF